MYSSTVPNDNGALFHCSEPTPRATTYRREFDEMEARIRKCERQRAELERQFEELMRERAECEKATVRAAKQRQRRQLEAERQRAERNESILRMLNKIDQHAASLAAKTDRLKMLKTQYEMYLMRTWSTSAQALPSVSSVPMIAAPPTMLSPLPQSPAKASTKSEFVQYLSDRTHQQTASINPIPPPTALSNYLASQQNPYGMASSYGPSLERPYSRALVGAAPIVNDRLMLDRDAGSSQPVVGGTKTKKFEMSNEDFIRYIDSEVLKEPIPKVSIVSPSPGELSETKPAGGAYLEDAAMSEDEPVGEVSKKMEDFSIVVEPTVKKDAAEEQKDFKETDEVVEHGLQNLEMDKTIPPEQEEFLYEQTPLVDTSQSHHETRMDVSSKKETKQPTENTENQTQQYVQEINEDYTTPEMKAPDDVVQIKSTKADDHHTILQEEPIVTNYDTEYIPPTVHEDYHEGAPTTEESFYPTDQTEHVPYDTQQYSTSNEEVTSVAVPEINPQQPQQPVQQYEARNQHWVTARQALRTKALPRSSSKPPSLETDITVQDTANDSTESWKNNQEEVQISYGSDQSNTVPQDAASNATYPEYSGESNEPYYQPEPEAGVHQDGGDQIPSSTGEAYVNDAMGPPVEYQPDDGQQVAAYEYGSNQEQVAYQEGQYVEGGTTGDAQYHYQEGVDQTGNAYVSQEQYQDPNQQYQYDPNAQYYSDQQAYDAQYYSQDPQQQEQQQYYMDETNQQHEGQYDQQQVDQNQVQQVLPAEQYGAADPNDQTYYPSDGQQVYEAPIQNADPIQPTEGGEVNAPSVSDAPPAEAQAVETSAVIDTTLPKDKQEQKASDTVTQPPTSEQKPAKKDGGDPGSDAPTLSTVNDESDFDFSSQ